MTITSVGSYRVPPAEPVFFRGWGSLSRFSLKLLMQVGAIIAIGYLKEEKAPHSLASLSYEKVSYNRYGE